MADDETPPETEDDTQIRLQDRWWWSATLSLVLGIVIVMLQFPSLQTGGVWLNWVVAVIGAAVAVFGLVRLIRAYQVVRSESD